MDLARGWVACEIKNGLFDNEVAVSVKDRDGKTVSLFVDKGLVDDNSTPSRLMVYFPVDSQTPRALLPTESFETGSRWLEMASVPEAA